VNRCELEKLWQCEVENFILQVYCAPSLGAFITGHTYLYIARIQMSHRSLLDL